MEMTNDKLHNEAMAIFKGMKQTRKEENAGAVRKGYNQRRKEGTARLKPIYEQMQADFETGIAHGGVTSMKEYCKAWKHEGCLTYARVRQILTGTSGHKDKVKPVDSLDPVTVKVGSVMRLMVTVGYDEKNDKEITETRTFRLDTYNDGQRTGENHRRMKNRTKTNSWWLEAELTELDKDGNTVDFTPKPEPVAVKRLNAEDTRDAIYVFQRKYKDKNRDDSSPEWMHTYGEALKSHVLKHPEWRKDTVRREVGRIEAAVYARGVPQPKVRHRYSKEPLTPAARELQDVLDKTEESKREMLAAYGCADDNAEACREARDEIAKGAASQ
jgi:hypothetical protein